MVLKLVCIGMTAMSYLTIGSLAYANYDSDIRYSYGAAAGVMEVMRESGW